MTLADLMFNTAEIIGLTAFAISGAMSAIEHKLDLFGVIFLAVITALGGGMIRDVLLGHLPPRAFFRPAQMLLATVLACLVFLAARLARNFYESKKLAITWGNNIFDALGLGAFAVTGAQTAVFAGYLDNPLLCIFLGLITAIGGGVLRDLLSREKPTVLYKHIYALAAMFGGGCYYLLYRWGVNQRVCLFGGIGLTFLIRMLATHYEWSLPKALAKENA